MGQLTRTQFGFTKTVRLTAAEIIAAFQGSDTASIILLDGEPGRIWFPVMGNIRSHWVADFSNIDGSCLFGVGVVDPLGAAGGPAIFQSRGSAADFFASGASVVVPLGISNGSTLWGDGATPVFDTATYENQPLVLLIDNQAAGPFADGDGTTLDVKIHCIEA